MWRTGSGGDVAGRDAAAPSVACDWPTWGYSVERPFATSCASDDHADDREAAPAALVLQLARRGHRDPDGRRRHASTSATGPGASTPCGRRDGQPRWTFTAKPRRLVYSGQIVASAAVADVGRQSARCSSRPARRCTRCGRRTARSCGATRSVRRGDARRPDRDRVVAGRRRRQGDLRLGRAQLRRRLPGRGRSRSTRAPGASGGSS